MIKTILTTIVLLAMPAAHLFAQEGPYVPCVGCEDFIYAPFPEPGHWYNPDQSGSGFILEFQNGRMTGYYFGYDAEGEPEWYLLNKLLTRSETPGVMWEAEVMPKRYSGGNCLGCPYQPNDGFVRLDPIKIEFLQRAYARVTYPDESIQYMVPIMYGDEGDAFFAEQTPYVFPRIAFNPYASLWTLVFRGYSEEEHAPWKWFSEVFMIEEGKVPESGPDEGKLRYGVWQPAPPPEGAAPFGEIICNLGGAMGEPVCTLIAGGLNPVDKPEFRIPIGNFTDSRFFGETEDGDTVQGFRLQYD